MSLCEIPSIQNESSCATALERLATRFDWRIRSPTGFSPLNDIDLPQDLANSFTHRDIISFERLSATGIVDHKHPLVQDIQTTWDELRIDINASVVSNHSLSKLFVETITVSCRLLKIL